MELRALDNKTVCELGNCGTVKLYSQMVLDLGNYRGNQLKRAKQLWSNPVEIVHHTHAY